MNSKKISSLLKKSIIRDDVSELCLAIAEDLRVAVGGEEYHYTRTINAGYTALQNPVERFVVSTSALMYGAIRAFVALASQGLEREALMMQRQVMEYSFRASYYSENQVACLYDSVEAACEEQRFLEKVKKSHASPKRLAALNTYIKSLYKVLTGKVIAKPDDLVKVLHQLRKKNGVAEPQSIEKIAQRYSRDEDYGMHYAMPSKISHASRVAQGYAEHPWGLPKFESGIASINAKACIVAEYAIDFLETLAKETSPVVTPNVRERRKSLTSIRRKIRMHRAKRPPKLRRKA
jgi:hypothetical protein